MSFIISLFTTDRKLLVIAPHIPPSLKCRRLPVLPLNLHHSRLLMRERDFAFFVETILLKIFDESVVVTSQKNVQRGCVFCVR